MKTIVAEITQAIKKLKYSDSIKTLWKFWEMRKRILV